MSVWFVFLLALCLLLLYFLHYHHYYYSFSIINTIFSVSLVFFHSECYSYFLCIVYFLSWHPCMVPDVRSFWHMFFVVVVFILTWPVMWLSHVMSEEEFGPKLHSGGNKRSWEHHLMCGLCFCIFPSFLSHQSSDKPSDLCCDHLEHGSSWYMICGPR